MKNGGNDSWFAQAIRTLVIQIMCASMMVVVWMVPLAGVLNRFYSDQQLLRIQGRYKTYRSHVPVRTPPPALHHQQRMS